MSMDRMTPCTALGSMVTNTPWNMDDNPMPPCSMTVRLTCFKGRLPRVDCVASGAPSARRTSLNDLDGPRSLTPRTENTCKKWGEIASWAILENSKLSARSRLPMLTPIHE